MPNILVINPTKERDHRWMTGELFRDQAPPQPATRCCARRLAPSRRTFGRDKLLPRTLARHLSDLTENWPIKTGPNQISPRSTTQSLRSRSGRGHPTSICHSAEAQFGKVCDAEGVHSLIFFAQYLRMRGARFGTSVSIEM